MFLKPLSFLVGYRFEAFLRPPRVPPPPLTPPCLDVPEIQEKARASLAAVGIFLAFSTAILVAIVSTDVHKVFDTPPKPAYAAFTYALLGLILPWLILREERRISAAKAEVLKETRPCAEKLSGGAKQRSECHSEVKTLTPDERNRVHAKRYWHHWLLAVWFVALLAAFAPIFLSPARAEVLGQGLSIGGFILVFSSAMLLAISVEFYDTASSWQSRDDAPYHFHLASIASHCYLLGLSLSFVGIALLLCWWHRRIGCTIAVAMLIVFVAMTEIERELSDTRTKREDSQPEAPNVSAATLATLGILGFLCWTLLPPLGQNKHFRLPTGEPTD